MVLVDEVIGSGATIRPLIDSVTRCGAEVVQKIPIDTEGNDDTSAIRLKHPPLFIAS